MPVPGAAKHDVIEPTISTVFVRRPEVSYGTAARIVPLDVMNAPDLTRVESTGIALRVSCIG